MIIINPSQKDKKKYKYTHYYSRSSYDQKKNRSSYHSYSHRYLINKKLTEFEDEMNLRYKMWRHLWINVKGSVGIPAIFIDTFNEECYKKQILIIKININL